MRDASQVLVQIYNGSLDEHADEEVRREGTEY